MHDVPNDQGGKVYVNWTPSSVDVPPLTTLYTYNIYRGVSAAAVPAGSTIITDNEYAQLEQQHMPASSAAQKQKAATTAPRVASNVYFTLPGPGRSSLNLYWQEIGSVPAEYLGGYSFAAPTLSDSGPQGNPRSYFMVRAFSYSYTTSLWYSNIDSGYSVDNLPPGAVSSVSAQPEAGSAVLVQWSPDVVDPDVGYYEIDRSTTSGFVPNLSTKIGTSFDTAFVDASPVSGQTNYYRIITFDIHGNMSPPSPQAAAGALSTNQYAVDAAWNMLSVPLTVTDYSKTVLFPTATSSAFTYEGSYVIKSTLANGEGYWLRFGGAQSVTMTGFLRDRDTVNVNAGWNMIGSISSAVDVGSISSIPAGIVTTQFFGYTNGYTVSPTIEPGKAYWVKVDQDGKLVLSSASMQTGADRIQIVPTSERPPAPPGDELADGGSGIPAHYGLNQNYPNPFNPSTVIRYELPAAGQVMLKVYNLLGQEVATLVNRREAAGYKAVTVSMNNLPSGIYVYRITAGTFSATKKMILMK